MRIQDAPTSPVSRFVESVHWVTRTRGRARRVDRLPDGRTALVLRVVESERRGDVTVVGPRTRALLKDATGFLHAAVVRFKPGWSTPLLGVSANTLADAYVALEDLWGRAGHDLLADLLGARTAPDVIERVAYAFTRRIPRAFEPTSAGVARRAATLMERGESRVDRVADRLGVTARHLRRAFSENIGVTPKDFLRSVRLQRALRMAATSSEWGRVAVEAGYYDQAHLIADFRDLVGLTPVAFLRRASVVEPPASDEVGGDA
ncbi:MAG: helix-turn-helix transcriptional regulator [Nannocystaceae bacterium]